MTTSNLTVNTHKSSLPDTLRKPTYSKDNESQGLEDGTRFPHVSIDPSLMTGATPSTTPTTYQAPEDSPPTLSPQEMSKAVESWGNLFDQMKSLYEPSHLLYSSSVSAFQPLQFSTQISMPNMPQVGQAEPVVESALTPAETKALFALHNALVGAGTKGLSLATMHAIEKIFLKSPEILTALAKKFPFVKTAAGLLPHPFIRMLGLVFPWTMEPIFTAWLRNQVGYQDPDPTGKYAPRDLAPVSTVLNWNLLQPWINQMMADRGELAQAVVAFAGTFAINALREFVTHLAIEWNKQNPSAADNASSQRPTPPTAKEKTQAALLSTVIRGPLELLRQAQRLNTADFPNSAALNKFLTDYWPGLIPAAMIYLQAQLARELAKYHAAGSAATSTSSPPIPPDSK